MTEVNQDLRNFLATLNNRVKKIEGMFNPESEDTCKTLHLMKDRKAIAINSAVRIKDVVLLYPNLNISNYNPDVDEGLSTLVLIPNDKEIVNEINKAYLNAFEYGIKKGIYPKNTTMDMIKRKTNESLFIDVNSFIANQKDDNKEFCQSLAQNKLMIRNVKVGNDETGKLSVVLRDREGKLLDPNERISSGDTGEIVIKFYPYSHKGKVGISRYIQGFIRTSECITQKSIYI